MLSQLKFLFPLITLFQLTFGYKYKFIFDSADIFKDCANQATNVVNVNGVLDLKELQIKLNNGIINMSGNHTTIWNSEVSDRLQGEFDLFRLDRGVWKPTFLSKKANDFCQEIFDESSYWYSFWTSHIINPKEAKINCLKVPGTKFSYDAFNIDQSVDLIGPHFAGIYMARVKLAAFDKNNVMKTPSACMEINAEAIRVH